MRHSNLTPWKVSTLVQNLSLGKKILKGNPVRTLTSLYLVEVSFVPWESSSYSHPHLWGITPLVAASCTSELH